MAKTFVMCVLMTCGVVQLQGWALGAGGTYVDRIELYLGDELVNSVRPLHRRRDVQRAFPEAAGPNCGFILQFPFPAGIVGLSEGEIAIGMRLKVRAGDTVQCFDCVATFAAFEEAAFAADYRLPVAVSHNGASSELVSIRLDGQRPTLL